MDFDSSDADRPPLPQLSVEIWQNVFSFLNTKPVELEMNDRPDTSALPVCMRVCSVRLESIPRCGNRIAS